jgi:hypothetical protein
VKLLAAWPREMDFDSDAVWACLSIPTSTTSSIILHHQTTPHKMPPSGPPTVKEIWKIALRTTDIIETNITKNVCLFGSAACSLWVNIGRIPGVRRATQLCLLYSFLTRKGLCSKHRTSILSSRNEIGTQKR